MSQFLWYTQAQTPQDTQSLIVKATHEQEKLAQSKRVTFSGKPQSSSSHKAEATRRTWCSHCQTDSHATNDCHSKTFSTCNFCKNKGHLERDSRKKAATNRSQLTGIRKAVESTSTSLFCKYCKADRHEIANCDALRPVFPDDFLKNPYKHCRKNLYRLKKFRTFFDMGIKLKDVVSTIETRHTFLNLTISNHFININLFLNVIAYLILTLWYN